MTKLAEYTPALAHISPALVYISPALVYICRFFVSDVTRDGFIFIVYTNSFAKTVFTGKVGDECVVPWQ